MSDEGIPGIDPWVFQLMEFCHEQAHESEHDVEDGVLISLTKREVWLTVLAWLLLSQSAECLAADCGTITERLAELVDTQKQHWRQRPSELS